MCTRMYSGGVQMCDCFRSALGHVNSNCDYLRSGLSSCDISRDVVRKLIIPSHVTCHQISEVAFFIDSKQVPE